MLNSNVYYYYLSKKSLISFILVINYILEFFHGTQRYLCEYSLHANLGLVCVHRNQNIMELLPAFLIVFPLFV